MTTETEKKRDPRTVTLKRVRLSFTDQLKDKKATVADGTPKHSCNLLLETDQPEFEANKAKVVAAIEAACEVEWKKPEKYKEIAEDTPKRVCFRKGERFKNQESGEVYKGYANNWAISGGTPGAGQRRPKLMDRRKRDVEEKDILEVMYGGSYADAIVSFYGTDKGGNGVFCTIEAIRSHQEGERMGGGIQVSADDFDDMDDGDSFGAADGTAAGDSDFG